MREKLIEAIDMVLIWRLDYWGTDSVFTLEGKRGILVAGAD
jgi:hypothetical protein